MKIKDMNKDQVLALLDTLMETFIEQDGGPWLPEYWKGSDEELKELWEFYDNYEKKVPIRGI